MNTKIISKKYRGFTLIELLVVIAIIGILSAVVIASVSNSRQKAKDATVKADLSVVMKQAELYLLNNNKYGSTTYPATGTCPVKTALSTKTIMYEDAVLVKAIVGATSNGAGTASARCFVNIGSWVIAVTLKDNKNSWCVDSTGVSKLEPVRAMSGAIDSTNSKAYKCK